MSRSRNTSRLRTLVLVVAVVLATGVPARAEPVAVQRVTAAGIDAWLVEDHANPLITVHVAFRGGAAADPDGKEGLARMAAALLTEGAGPFGSQEFQLRLEDLAVRLNAAADLDAVSVTLQTLRDVHEEAFLLLRLALTEPRFDAEPVARVRSQMQAAVRRARESPGAETSRAFYATLFPDHPYGRPARGTEVSLATINTTDLRDFVERRLAQDAMVIGVVGAVTPDELKPLLEDTFAALPARAAPIEVPSVKPAADGDTIVVERPFPQSTIAFGQPGVTRDDPDYYAAQVVNHVLGGGSFVSRLFQQVREERGLAYSIYSSLVPFDHSALLLGRASTANAQAGDTIALIRQEWQRMAEHGLTPEEVAEAKTYLTGSFPLNFTSSDRIAGILAAMQHLDLGIDYLQRRNTLVEAVTLEQANRVARELLRPKQLTMVVLGQPEGLDASP
ncbi:MAG: insulinase family protein [Rhodospirillales bacterium]|nr:MAG: insulinase family protein [Rhodospirillales bacterium]